MNQKNVLILVNKQTTIIKFRLEVVQALVNEGYKVYVSVPEGDRLDEIRDTGAEVIVTPMDKESTDPIKDLKLFNTYRRLIKETKADVVLTYTIKPNVYGGLAATTKGIPYVANITGLGKALENGGVIQKISLILYRFGFSRVSKVFFQNESNKDFFKQKGLLKFDHEIIPGSGVNLNKFQAREYPDDKTIEFAFISRIMKEKGIEEYLEAAEMITRKYPNTVFHVAGFGSEEYEKRMQQLHDEGRIIYHGLLDNVQGLITQVHCVVHPTFYPEGMSNILLESAASCRPIITTDRPGSREAVDDGENGYLIEAQNSNDLIEKIEKFLNLTHEQKAEMGTKGREKMQREFDRNIIVNKYLTVVNQLAKLRR